MTHSNSGRARTEETASAHCDVRPIPLERASSRSIHRAGVLTWVLAGAPILWAVLCEPQAALEPRTCGWFLGYALFGVGYFAQRERGPVRMRVAVSFQILGALIAGLAIPFVSGLPLSAVLLVVAAARLAEVMATSAAVGIILGQTSGLAACYLLVGLSSTRAVLLASMFGAFQYFAFFAVRTALLEARGRRELALALAENEATRVLLEDTTRRAEREHLSRELHDVLGHHLAALSVHLEVATHADADASRVAVRSAQALTKLMLADVRAVVRDSIATPGVDLPDALRRIVPDIPSPSVEFDLDPALTVESSAVAHGLVRCSQELVTNAIRHADADRLWLAVRQHADHIDITACDDGIGFAPGSPEPALRTIRERVEDLGGELRVGPSSRGVTGLEVRIQLPLEGST